MENMHCLKIFNKDGSDHFLRPTTLKPIQDCISVIEKQHSKCEKQVWDLTLMRLFELRQLLAKQSKVK